MAHHHSELINTMAEIITGGENKGPIKIPAWDDVLHIGTRPLVTAADKRALDRALIIHGVREQSIDQQRAAVEQMARTQGEVGGITKDKALEILRRREVAEQIRSSEIPAWRQKMISTLTALDNIEDDISTFVWIAGPLLDRFAAGKAITTVLRGTSTTLDRIQQVIAGPTIYGRRMKDKASRQRRAIANQRKGKMGAVQGGVSWIKKNWGHLLEAGQSADTHLGVGISLGAIFGAMEEAQDRALLGAWNAGKYAVASIAAAVPGIPLELRESLNEQADLAIDEIRSKTVPLVEQLNGLTRGIVPSLTPLGTVLTGAQALGVFPDLPIAEYFKRMTRAAGAALGIAGDNPLYTQGEHALALYSARMTNTLLAEAARPVLERFPPEQIAELPMPRTVVTNEVTRAILEDYGCTFNADGEPMDEWQDPEWRLDEYVDQAAAQYFLHHNAWLPKDNAGDRDLFMHSMAEFALPIAPHILTGSPDGIRTQYEAPVRAEMALYDTGLYPPRATPPDVVAAWLDTQVAAIDDEEGDWNMEQFRKITAEFWPTSPLPAQGDLNA